MIGTINIKVSASRPNMPLGPFHVFAGSAASFTIVDIPLPLGVRKVTGVTLSAKNVAGITTGYAAVRVGSAWGVTVPPSKFVASGSVVRGIAIMATGIDDAGAAVTPWKLGAGDVFIMEPDGSVAPGETVHDLHWHDSRPANPVGGDVAPYEGQVYYFNGTAWIAFAASGTGDVKHSEFSDLSTLQPGDSLGIVKERVNMVIGKLKGTVAAVAALLCLESFAELCPTNVLDDVSGTNTLREIVASGDAVLKSGGVMDNDSTLSFNGNMRTEGARDKTFISGGKITTDVAPSMLSSSPRPVSVMTGDGLSVQRDTRGMGSSVTTNRASYGYSSIVRKNGDNTYTYSFPTASGTLALAGGDSDDNAVILTNRLLMTKGGVQIAPSSVGAIAAGVNRSTSFSLNPSLGAWGGSSTSFSSSEITHNVNGGAPVTGPDDLDQTAWDWLKFSSVGLGSWLNAKFIRSESDPTVPAWAKAANPPASMPDNGLVLTNGSVKTKSGTAIVAADVGAYPNSSGTQLAGQVSTIGAHLNAEDARFVSTNYNSVTHMPEAYVEIKLPDQSWSVIWREMTRWNWMLDTYLPTNYFTKGQVNAALAEKADRGWGAYDSETGAYAPDGYTWISSSRIAIAANMAYQKTLTTEGAIWVLESNGLVTETGGVSSNGFFRISDDEGNTQFEIVKGDKRTIGADASSCQVVAGFTPTKLQIGYSVLSDSHPTIYVCNSLTTQQWKSETDADCLANVTWSGSSGAWVAQVQGKSAQAALFVKATYETGGDTIIRNAAPVEMQYLYIGGQKYSVGTASISGHTVLTLTPAL